MSNHTTSTVTPSNKRKTDDTKRFYSTANSSNRFYDIRERGTLAEKKEKLALEA